MRDPDQPRPTEVWFPDGALLRLDVPPPIRVRDDVAKLLSGWLLRLPARSEASDELVRAMGSLGLEVVVTRTPGCTTIRVSAPLAAGGAGVGALGSARG